MPSRPSGRGAPAPFRDSVRWLPIGEPAEIAV